MTREEARGRVKPHRWPCGHERIGGPCRVCAERERQTAYRVRYLPQQIEATERKLAALRNEARRYGMTHLLGAE